MINKIENEVDFLNKKINNFLFKKSSDATKEEHIRAIQKYAPSLPQKEYEILIHNINLMQKMELEEIAFIEFKRFGKAIPFSEYSKNIGESFKDSEQFILRIDYENRLNKFFSKYYNTNNQSHMLSVISSINDSMDKYKNGRELEKNTIIFAHFNVIKEHYIKDNHYSIKIDGKFKYGNSGKGIYETKKRLNSAFDFLQTPPRKEKDLDYYINNMSDFLYKKANSIISSPKFR